MDFSAGIPPESRTMVVVPTMLTERRGIEDLLEALEVRYLANRDDASALRPADRFSRRAAGDAAGGRAAAAAGAGGHRGAERASTAMPTAGDALLPLPPPAPLESAGAACGWATSASAESSRSSTRCCAAAPTRRDFRVIVGDTSILPDVKYVITLDTDTQLPRDAARELVGTMAHPLNRPRFDAKRGSGSSTGYGILQPRVGVSLPSAEPLVVRAAVRRRARASIPTRARCRTCTRTCSTKARSSARASTTSTPSSRRWPAAFPENRILSHDLLEGCYARSGLVSDVQLYEEYPVALQRGHEPAAPLDSRRLADRAWLLPRVPGADGAARRIRSRVCAVEDPRQPAAQPRAGRRDAALAAGAGVLCRPAGSGRCWCLAIILLPAVVCIAGRSCCASRRICRGRCTCAAPVARHGRAASRRQVFTLAFLPYDAFFSLDAIVRTLCAAAGHAPAAARMATSQRRRTHARAPVSRGFYVSMWIAPVLAAGDGASCLVLARPAALAWRAPILALWFVCARRSRGGSAARSRRSAGH